jgi:membrane-associated protease RseP (regulator of RpoE activity)
LLGQVDCQLCPASLNAALAAERRHGMAALRNGVLAVLGTLLLLGGWTSHAVAEDKDKGEPEAGAAAQLKRYIQVRGTWGNDGFRVTAVKQDGPAAKLKSADGKTEAALQPGDVIVEVEGTKITSEADYAKAMNGAKNPDKIEIKVKDTSGKVNTWYVGSKDNPFAR